MANYHFATADRLTVAPAASGATLAQRVYKTLHEEIVTGALGPGDRLVRRTLSRRLGVSPMPVTEALLRLEVDGLVESRPLYGCRVRLMTLEDVENDESLREAIECQAARLCAENGSEAALSRLMAKARPLDRMMTAQRDSHSKLGMQMHLEFHTGIGRYGGFPRLAEELSRVWFRRVMRLIWIKATRYKLVPENWHQQLVRAIASRDPQRAEDKMREHVRYGREEDRRALEYFLAQQSIADDDAPGEAEA